MGTKLRAALFSGAAVLLVCLALFLTRITWLEAIGRYLADTQPPQRSDMIVVLGGDWNGNRILKAAQLAKEGYAPHVLVSGGGYFYGNYEGDLAVPFAVRHGYDEKLFIKFLYPAGSTRDEAQTVVPELRRRGVKSYIVVTSEFHTHRAEKIFRELAPDLTVRMVAPPEVLAWNNWWKTREGRKIYLMEWTKTLTSTVGM
jgi:uncharacterized SAM-binding protein YcdF (DUF218 family)